MHQAERAKVRRGAGDATQDRQRDEVVTPQAERSGPGSADFRHPRLDQLQ